jgi:hypothetical protein
MHRRRISAFALAAVAALALTAELPMAEQRRVGQYLPWQQMGSSPALNDLPSAPGPAPSRANDRLRIAGPATRAPTPTAWHESVLLGDIVAARKGVPHSAAPKSQANDGKYVVKGLPGRPK